MTFKRLLTAAFALSACREIPDGTLQYHLTKTDLRLDVTRTVQCSIRSEKDETGKVVGPPTDPNNFVIVTTAVTPIPMNSADTASTPGTIDLASLKGTFTDPDVGVEFYADGRLKSINTTQTGTAKQILDSTLTLVSTVASGGNRLSTDRADDPVQQACKYIFEHSREEKGQLSLNYSAKVVARAGTHRTIEPLETSAAFHEALKGFGQIKDIHVSIRPDGISPLSKPVITGTEQTNKTLTARQPSKVSLYIHEQGGQQLWTGTALMALPGNEFQVPLPGRPAFGTAKFQLALDDTGAISKISYAATSGANDAIDLATSVVDEAQGSTAAEQADAIKAEVELIKQRQRLANCQADPVNCQ